MDEGIYFGMPFDEYLAIPALSNSGVKDFMSSPYRFWYNSNFNPDRPVREETDCQKIGTSYHCAILEGLDVFNANYVTAFDASEYPDALKTTDDIKAALRGLKDIGHDVKLTGKKEFLIEQLLNINPMFEIIDALKAEYEEKHKDKILLPQSVMDDILKAAYMVSLHPDAKRTFSGGYPETTCIWKVDGILHKCRFDYLGVKYFGELKTFENSGGRNIDRVPSQEVAKYRYYIQFSLYLEALSYARNFAKSGKVFGNVDTKWIKSFADFSGENKCVSVFIDKSLGEIRGKVFGECLTKDCGMVFIEKVREGYKRCMDKYGTDTPWIEPVAFTEFDDSEFPPWAFD